MARAGTFGGSLNPFGGGSLGGFSAYDIGSNLAELELYRVEVAWGNGTATDEEYLEALTKARDATSPETRDRESSQNRLDDAVYRIGRSKADEQGLDALIAFDQAALAKMNPDNVRFRSVSDSLDAELAERRSKDYGELVRRYNEGGIKTQTLVDWVQNALRGLDAEDPDFLHWTDTADDLDDRLKSEEDQRVYQDYQQRRMSPEKFLAYLTERRDAFDPQGPQYEDWDRRLEDATDQVKQDRLARQDSAFFNRYEEGKVSDNAYLAYIGKRIDGMESDDPQLGEWKHRLHQAAFSIAEDKLRFAVERNKAPESKLRAFYVNYRKTLNPGSAEYRQITRAIMSLGGGGGGGGGGRSGGGGGGGGGGVKGLGAKGSPKLINPNYTLTNIVPLLTIDVRGSDKQVRTATKALDLNVDSLQNALQRGDAVWVFQDPRKPASFIPGKYPDGSPMLDTKGKPVMVPGSAYLPVTNEAYTNLLGIQTDLHYKLAGKALANHDAAGYYYQLKLAGSSEDRARRASAQAIERDNRTFYETAQDGIDLALKIGDYATAVNLAIAVQQRLDSELGNPMLDDTRRTALERIGDKLSQNKILPVVDPFTGQRSGGAIDIENSTLDANGNFTAVGLLPGWHQTLDQVDARGSASWGLTFDEKQDGSWEADHITVHTTYGGRVVTGEVKRGAAPTNSRVIVKTPEGYIKSDVGAEYIHYVDENGKTVKAYSLDGVTWVRSMTGAPPSVEVNVDLELGHDDDGNDAWVDAATKEVVFSRNQDGSYSKNQGYFDNNPGAQDWYGMGGLRRRQAVLNRVKTTKADGTNREGQFVSGEEERYLYGVKVAGSIGGGVEVGAPGQSMQVVTMSPSGSLNLTSMSANQSRDSGIRGVPRETRDDYGLRVYQEPKVKYAPKSGAPTINAQTGFTTSPASNVNAFTGFTIGQQLPADTPDRWDGEGFRRSPVTPPSLRPTGRPVLPAATLTTPLPAAKKVLGTPIKPPAKKRPTPKRRTTPKPPARRPGARIGTGTASVNRGSRAL